MLRRVLERKIPIPWVRRVLWASLALFVVGVAGTIVGLNWLARDLPPVDTLRRIDPSVKTVIYAAGGETLREFFTENRTIVPLDRIPLVLQHAVVAVEDRRFYSHYGVDLRRVLGDRARARAVAVHHPDIIAAAPVRSEGDLGPARRITRLHVPLEDRSRAGAPRHR